MMAAASPKTGQFSRKSATLAYCFGNIEMLGAWHLGHGPQTQQPRESVRSNSSPLWGGVGLIQFIPPTDLSNIVAYCSSACYVRTVILALRQPCFIQINHAGQRY